MLKFFSFGKTQGGVLITLLVLISLGAAYFFIYLPGNESTVQEQRFRCLRKIDASIRAKITNSEKQITTLLNTYANDSRSNDRNALKKTKKYIKSDSKTNFT